MTSLFHLANNEQATENDKLHKISRFHDIMQERWNQFYRLSPNLTLDEGMIPFSGRLSFLQFIKGKPTRWGIKAFMLASSATGYVYQLKIYTGKGEQTSNIKDLVEGMVEGLNNSCHILYLDNFYTSTALLQSLRTKGIRCSGTLKMSRIKNKEIGESFKKMKKGQIKFFTNDPDYDLTLTLWKDKNQVIFLSNHREALTEDMNEGNRIRTVPTVRTHYNEKARGVDKANQHCNSYRYNHNEKKWWKPVFEQIFQVTLSNIYTIHSFKTPGNGPNHKYLERINFHLEIIRYLIHEDRVERPLKLKHYLDWVPEKRKYLVEKENTENGQQQKRDFRLVCKAEGCSKKSDLHCVGCSRNTFMCTLCVPSCFIEYHKKLNA